MGAMVLLMRPGSKMSPEQKERVKAAHNTPIAKLNHSRASKEVNSRPEVRKKISQKVREACSSFETKERKRLAAQKSWGNNEIRNNMICGLKKACSKLDIRNKNRTRQIEVWSQSEIKLKVSGPNHYNWKGGITHLPYCPKFNDQLKEEIRSNFGYKCFLCPHIQGKRKLNIHHIDYNKQTLCNGKKWPLIPLCQRCHGKTNHNRWYWFNLLINYWAINQEINFMEYG